MKAKYKRGRKIESVSDFEKSEARFYKVMFGKNERTKHRGFLESWQYHTLEMFIRGGKVYEAEQTKQLTATDFRMANDPQFMAENPDVRAALIDHFKEYQTRECVECIFFRWQFDKDRRISGGMCTAKQEIEKDKFEYGKVAEGCPLRE